MCSICIVMFYMTSCGKTDDGSSNQNNQTDSQVKGDWTVSTSIKKRDFIFDSAGGFSYSGNTKESQIDDVTIWQDYNYKYNIAFGHSNKISFDHSSPMLQGLYRKGGEFNTLNWKEHINEAGLICVGQCKSLSDISVTVEQILTGSTHTTASLHDYTDFYYYSPIEFQPNSGYAMFITTNDGIKRIRFFVSSYSMNENSGRIEKVTLQYQLY